jgi:hypothetical protein
MAADTNAPGRVRNFIQAPTTRSRLPVHLKFHKWATSYNRIVRDPSHMIKKDQLIARLDATLWLGHRYVRLRADQGLDNEQVRR